ncbi:MAG: autotransporter domain-containing protein [Pseudomonadota bacterium]
MTIGRQFLLVLALFFVCAGRAAFAFDLSGDPRLPATISATGLTFAANSLCRLSRGTSSPFGRIDQWRGRAGSLDVLVQYSNTDDEIRHFAFVSRAPSRREQPPRLSAGDSVRLLRTQNGSGVAALAIRMTLTEEDLTRAAALSPVFEQACINPDDPPAFSLSFEPAVIPSGGTSTLTLTIDNAANSLDAGQLNFSGTLPDGLFTTSPPRFGSTCQNSGGFITSSGFRLFGYSGGTAAARSSCQVTFEVTAPASGNYTATSNALSSTLGNSGRASGTLTVLDPGGPTVTITPDADGFRGTAPFGISVTFSADVTGFTADDIQAANGTVSNFAQVNPSRYTADIVPTSGAAVTVSVPAGAAIDAANRPNDAAVPVTVEGEDLSMRARNMVRNFLSGRMDTIAANGPGTIQRLSPGPQGGQGNLLGYAAGGEPGNIHMSFHTSLRAIYDLSRRKRLADPAQFQRAIVPAGGSVPVDSLAGERTGFDVWAKGKYARVRNSGRRSDVGLLYLGVDYRFSADLVLGLLGQMDWTDEHDRTTSSNAKGTGWLIGPYVVARLTQDLIFDGRAAIGSSDNKISPLGTFRDDFDTTRFLISGQFTGGFTIASVNVNPFVQLLYFKEIQHGYTDSLGNRIARQRPSLGRLRFGPKVSTTFRTAEGLVISPHLTVSGLYDFNRARQVNAQGLTVTSSRVRGKLEAGLNIRTSDDWQIEAEGFYDGIGRQHFESYGGSLSLTVPLN